jgi:hypothetical protein
MFHELLSEISILSEKSFVLVDVGASGDPAPIWQEIAPFSFYIGFDPDLRELKENNAYNFKRFVLVNKAVTDNFSDKVNFFLTSSPYCSSLLKPNLDNCKHYSFTELFEIENCVELPATRLDEVIRDLEIPGIDWLKLDSQGKDLDIFLSINKPVRERILAVDVEPGLIPFYEGENTFDQTHKALIQEGFWLANLNVQNFPRIKQSTRKTLWDNVQQQHAQLIDFERLPGSPTAIETRYLRTIEHLKSVNADLRDYVTLWVFALLDGKTGFAFDIAAALMDCPETEPMGRMLLEKTIATITQSNQFQPLNPPAFLADLKLREINLIAVPDWQQPEEQIYAALEAVIRSLLLHSDGQRLHLLISTANLPSALLSQLNDAIADITLHLLMSEEGINPDCAPEITLLENLTQSQWQALLPHLKARLVLPQEDQLTLNQVSFEQLPSLTLAQLTAQPNF